MRREYDCPTCNGESVVIDPEDDRREMCRTCHGTGMVTIETPDATAGSEPRETP